VLDDGFQHWRLWRDLDIVLVDALNPFGYNHLLPRGMLREPPAALGRAGVVVVTRSDQVAEERLAGLKARVSSCAPSAPVVTAVHEAVDLVDHDAVEVRPLLELVGAPVAAFSGTGNPEAFGMSLRGLGAKVVLSRRFPDHHVFTERDLDDVFAGAAQRGARFVLMTEKDAVKVRADPSRRLPLLVLRVRMRLAENAEALWQRVRRALGGARPPAGAP